MGTLYPGVSVSGYDPASGRPSDDGAQTSANQVKWATHKTRIGDPLKTAVEAVDSALSTYVAEGPTAKSSAYTTAATDHNTTLEVSGTTTISLLDASTGGAGYRVKVKNAGSGTVTVDTDTGTDGIDGESSVTLLAGESSEFQVNVAADGYLELADKRGTTYEALSGTIAPHKDLTVTLNSSNPDFEVDVTSSQVVLEDSNGQRHAATSVSLTINATSSGAANQLDTGTIANSTWYYVWVIYNGTTVAGLLSTSATSPTMPSGYTYKALVGAVQTDGSADFIYLYQRDDGIVVNQADNVAATAANYGSLTEVDLSSYIPPIAKKVHLYMEQSGVGGNQGTHDVAIDSSGNATLTFQTHNTATGRTSQNAWLVLKSTSLWFERGVNNPALTLAVLGWSY